MKKQPAWAAHAALSAVALFYGINYFVAKRVFPEVPPFALVALRSGFAALFFFLWAWMLRAERIERRDWPLVLVCSVFGVIINQIFFLWGLENTTEINASVLQITSPVFVFLAALVLRTERFVWQNGAGLVLAFVGAALIITGGLDFRFDTTHLMGDIMITVNAASYGLYLVLVKPLAEKYRPITVMRAVFGIGMLAHLPLGIPYLLRTDWAHLTPFAWGGVVYIIIAVTILTFGLNAWAMQRVPASYVGIYIYLQPVIATLLTAFTAPDALSWEKAGYMVLVFTGVGMVIWRRKKT